MIDTEKFNQPIRPFTVVYLVNGGQVLLLRKRDDAKMLAGEWIGIGGKIDPGEDLYESAKREFLEETGLSIGNLLLQGTFTWFIESGSAEISNAGISHLITAISYTGEFVEQSSEGVLEWHAIGSVASLKNLTSYQQGFLPDMLLDRKYFYSGISVFDENHKRISHASSAPYLQQ